MKTRQQISDLIFDLAKKRRELHEEHWKKYRQILSRNQTDEALIERIETLCDVIGGYEYNPVQHTVAIKTIPANPRLYYLDQDDDGHWFVIPVDKKEEFDAYVEQYRADKYPENELPLPDGVMQLNGSYTRVTFENPVIE